MYSYQVHVRKDSYEILLFCCCCLLFDDKNVQSSSSILTTTTTYSGVYIILLLLSAARCLRWMDTTNTFLTGGEQIQITWYSCLRIYVPGMVQTCGYLENNNMTPCTSPQLAAELIPARNYDFASFDCLYWYEFLNKSRMMNVSYLLVAHQVTPGIHFLAAWLCQCRVQNAALWFNRKQSLLRY